MALEQQDVRERIAALEADDDRRIGLVQQVLNAEERMKYAAELFGAGELDRDSFDALRSGAKTAADQARAELDALGSTDIGDALAVDLRDRWDTLTVSQRRKIIELVAGSITVSPARPGTRRFDPERITIGWRQP